MCNSAVCNRCIIELVTFQVIANTQRYIINLCATVKCNVQQSVIEQVKFQPIAKFNVIQSICVQQCNVQQPIFELTHGQLMCNSATCNNFIIDLVTFQHTAKFYGIQSTCVQQCNMQQTHH